MRSTAGAKRVVIRGKIRAVNGSSALQRGDLRFAGSYDTGRGKLAVTVDEWNGADWERVDRQVFREVQLGMMPSRLAVGVVAIERARDVLAHATADRKTMAVAEGVMRRNRGALRKLAK